MPDEDERDRAREQADQQQHAAERLEHAAEAQQRKQGRTSGGRGREAEQLLRAVLDDTAAPT